MESSTSSDVPQTTSKKPLSVLMLSGDARIFEVGSSVAERMILYGTLFENLLIVVVHRGEERELQLAPNVRVVTAGGKGKVSTFFKARTLLGSLLGTEIDIVSTQDPFFIGLLGLNFARKKDIPIQIQLHTDCFSLGFICESFQRLLEVCIAWYVLRNASCIRVVSLRIQKSVRKVTQVSSTVLPLFVSREVTAPAKNPRITRAIRLVAVSRLTREKRINLIIDAVSKIPNTILTIVGDGPERLKLEKMVIQKGVGSRVHFVGWQDPTPYYAEADVFVHASRYEGYGVAIIEAALSGLAIVATDVGIVQDIIKDEDSVLVVDGTVQSIQRGIERLVLDNNLLNALGVRAKQEALNHTQRLEKYLSCYQEALTKCIT